MIVNQFGKPYKNKVEELSANLLFKASVNLLNRFSEDKPTIFGTLLYDQFNKPIPRIGTAKTIKFRRYQSFKENDSV